VNAPAFSNGRATALPREPAAGEAFAVASAPRIVASNPRFVASAWVPFRPSPRDRRLAHPLLYPWPTGTGINHSPKGGSRPL